MKSKFDVGYVWQRLNFDKNSVLDVRLLDFCFLSPSACQPYRLEEVLRIHLLNVVVSNEIAEAQQNQLYSKQMELRCPNYYIAPN